MVLRKQWRMAQALGFLFYTHAEDSDGVPGGCLQPGPALADAAFGGVNQRMTDNCISSMLFCFIAHDSLALTMIAMHTSLRYVCLLPALESSEAAGVAFSSKPVFSPSLANPSLERQWGECKSRTHYVDFGRFLSGRLRHSTRQKTRGRSQKNVLKPEFECVLWHEQGPCLWLVSFSFKDLFVVL